MNHFKMSIIKSIIRIVGTILGLFCACAAYVYFTDEGATELAITYLFWGLGLLSASFFTAEIIGILEETFDKRKEE